MKYPQIATTLADGSYGQREMTDEEYADLLASGWTLEGTNETPSPD
jgi:hypothetical protein